MPNSLRTSCTVDTGLLDQDSGYRYSFPGVAALVALGSAVGHKLDVPVTMRESFVTVETGQYGVGFTHVFDADTGGFMIRVVYLCKVKDQTAVKERENVLKILDIGNVATAHDVADYIRARFDPATAIDPHTGSLVHVPTGKAEKVLEDVAQSLNADPRTWKSGLNMRAAEYLGDDFSE